MFPFSFIGSGVDAQALASYNSLIAAGYTVPQGLAGINSAFTTIKTIYGTSDITNAVSYFADPSLAYQSGAGSGTTLGQAIRTLPNLVDNTRATDAVQTTAASQPLLLVHSGANYWQSVGVAGNFVSTPNAAANRITGDLSIETEIQPLVVSGTLIIISKFFAGDGTYFLRIANNIPQLGLFTLSNVENVYSATTNTGFSANQKYFLRVSRDSSTGIIKFFTSLDGISYTQLGSDVSGFTGSIRSSSSIVEVGLRDGSLAPFNGKIFSIKLFPNTTFTSESVSFNPNQYNASVSQTQWTSSTGEIWSINTGTDATGYKGVLVDRTIMQGDGIDDGLTQSSNTLNFVNGTTYRAWRIFETTKSNTSIVSLGNNPNEIDNKNTNNTINNVSMFAPALNLRFAAMQRNESTLQGIANVNNGATITNSISALGTNLNRVYLFRNIFNQNANGIVNTIIVTPLLDNSTTRTLIYNYVRTINNNAF
jgi:hypothetical protein